MYFQSFKEFIEMGGHGFSVWLSYAVVFSALVVYFIYSKQLAQTSKKDLVKFYKRMDARNLTISVTTTSNELDSNNESSSNSDSNAKRVEES